MQKVFRHLVSQNKKRHQDGDFDLDLTYLTDEIIAMGLPASGSEAMYCNPIDEVVRFLETHHAERYKVLNLCNERSYDISKFGASCASFPFDDHGAPPMPLVCAFCASAKSWLLGSLENVVVVHCKAGKGRTGVTACCLLLHLGYQRDADAAIAFYNHRRTRDGRGLTVPSQRRYVRYYARQLSARPSLAPMPRLLVGVQVDGVPAGLPYLAIVLQEHGGPTVRQPHQLVIDLEAVVGATQRLACRLRLREDVKVELHSPETAICRMWIHPAFEPATARFAHDADKFQSDVDVVTKGILPKGFALTLFDDDAPQSSKEPDDPTSPVATSTRRASGDRGAESTAAEPAELETAVV